MSNPGKTISVSGKQSHFMADAIITHLRSGHRPTDADVLILRLFEVIDDLRERITEEDVDWILLDIPRQSGPVMGLLLSLLRWHSHKADIQHLLRSRWENADSFERAHLFWRLLDDPQLPQEWHQRLMDWVLSEDSSPHFEELIVEFFGQAKDVLPGCLQRLGDSSFPTSKKWAYVCAAAVAAEDQSAAKGIVMLAQDSSDPFTRSVASQLVSRFAMNKASVD